MPPKKRKPAEVSLVLSSGGARGLAHIGVIEEINSRGYKIVSIAGSSMGAFIGGLYATGNLDKYKEWVSGLDKLDVIRLMDFALCSQGFLKGEKVFQKMRKLRMIPDVNIEDLPIPYLAIAVDIVNNQEIIFSSGSLNAAIRASISIPDVFTPVSFGEGLLVDGGVLNPLPLNAVTRNSSLLVAVDLNALIPYEYSYMENHGQAKPSTYTKGIDLLMKKWESFFGNHTKGEADKALQNVTHTKLKSNLGYLDILTRSVQLMQSKLTQYSIAAYPPDLLVSISKSSCSVFEFYRAKEIIGYGREVCAKTLDNAGL